MYKKVSTIFDKLLNIKPLFIICIIFFILNLCIFCTKVTLNNQWGKLSDYPEDVYKSLEEEAYILIQNKDFVSEYNLTIMHYDNQSNYLSMRLSSGSPTLTINVYNYGKDNQKITIKRDRNNHPETIFTNIITLLLFSILFALFGVLGILILLLILLFITFIIDKIKIKNKKI